MDDLNPPSDNRIAARDSLTKGFVAAIGAKDFLRLDDAEKVFLTQILEDFEADELPDLDIEDINRAIADFWSYGAQRGATQTLRRIVPLLNRAKQATAYDVVEIVQGDSPFIVETVMGELIDQGVSIRSMFHPVITVHRDFDGKRVKTGDTTKESMMLVFIERQGADKHKAILDGLDESLNDLKLAVRDFPRMQKLLAQEIEALEALRGKNRIAEAILDENLAFLRWVDANHFVFPGRQGLYLSAR